MPQEEADAARRKRLSSFMQASPVNEDEVYQDLASRCAGWGNTTKTAAALDITVSALWTVLCGNRRIPQALGEAMGWELRWVRKETSR